MKVVGIIPARMASSRFPGKPLAPIHGLPMIEHVHQRARLAKSLDDVVVATCDREIVAAAQRFGARAIMTAPTHERGTDRVAEAARSLDADVIVNVQGDEPMLDPAMLDLVVQPLLEDRTVRVSNLVRPLARTEAAISDPNVVKAVFDARGNALYFSRSILPGLRYAPVSYPRFAQLGIYAFTREMLQTYAKLPPTPLEAAESVDMLRLLEHGYSIQCPIFHGDLQAVDTPADLSEVEHRLTDDPLMRQYLRR
jgi:3-deoxy-manno-octulosonate cytidylyltransferase (CMP-KDO synthetase)